MAVINEAYDLELFRPREPQLQTLTGDHKVKKDKQRRSRRQSVMTTVFYLMLGVVLMAVIGYIGATIYAFAAGTPAGFRVVVLSYLFSGVLILVFNKVFHIRASGQAAVRRGRSRQSNKEVPLDAREDHFEMQRVQAEKLQHDEEQEEQP